MKPSDDMPMKRARIVAGVAAFAAAGCAALTGAGPGSSARDCFDALVLAEVVGQVPGDFPDPEYNGHVMSWPYFIDLRIERVVAGQIIDGEIAALSVQHSYWRDDLGTRKWWLRRNAQGTYNILRIEGGARPGMCPAGEAPAPAYLTPGPGQTLDDLRKAAEQRHGSRP
ncbi:hypothetical protein GRI72_04230 [Altererythrobacter marinus]|uniref:Lipoprotein n=1 Tax=Pelagerythrobacter marinus TaxID=538382 RepID=A0ABW9UVV1_9SPHN|nr:hypothetical protein [Pelagerythrobacter marinus]MXO68037.1 hypothetical protein [Pelagerythrobacter marinus]